MAAVGDLEAGDWVAERSGAISHLSSGAEVQAEARAKARLVARAFARLPVRWRAVLWQLEVEGNAPVVVAPLFGLSANGRLSRRRRAAVHEHLRQCPACTDLFTELSELNSRLGAMLGPAVLAGSSAAAATGSLGDGGLGGAARNLQGVVGSTTKALGGLVGRGTSALMRR
jgi:hypothetical protein